MKRNGRKLPTYCKEIKKAMIDQDLDMKGLAKALGYSVDYISMVVNGNYDSPAVREKIYRFLNITCLES